MNTCQLRTISSEKNTHTLKKNNAGANQEVFEPKKNKQIRSTFKLFPIPIGRVCLTWWSSAPARPTSCCWSFRTMCRGSCSASRWPSREPSLGNRIPLSGSWLTARLWSSVTCMLMGCLTRGSSGIRRRLLAKARSIRRGTGSRGFTRSSSTCPMRSRMWVVTLLVFLVRFYFLVGVLWNSVCIWMRIISLGIHSRLVILKIDKLKKWEGNC